MKRKTEQRDKLICFLLATVFIIGFLPLGSISALAAEPESNDVPVAENAAEEIESLSADAQAFVDMVNTMDKNAIVAAVETWAADPENEELAAAMSSATDPIAEADDLYLTLSTEEQANEQVIAAYTKLSDIYQAANAAMEPTAVYADSDFNFSIVYNDTVDVPVNFEVTFLDGIALQLSKKDGSAVTGTEEENYQIRIKNVTSSEGNYTWNGTDATATSSANDGGSYTVTFGVWNVENGAWVPNINGASDSYTKTITARSSAEIKDKLDTDDQFISYAFVKSTRTGTGGLESFDADDQPGNDSSSDNDIVRTFDSIDYTLSVASQSYTNGAYYKKGYVGYRFVLPYSSSEAEFDTATMGWLVSSTGTNYDYKITTETIDGVSCQVLTGYRYLDANVMEAVNTFPVTNLDVNLAVKVKNMKNGVTVTPQAYTWVDHNDVDFSDLDHVCTNNHLHSSASNDGKELVEIELPPVKVSAAPRYNVQLKRVGAAQVDAVDSFNFSTGNEKALNSSEGDVYGRLVAYGVTLQLYNNATGKGLKGVELPTGDITFDVIFAESYKPNSGSAVALDLSGTDSDYTPLVWSYEGNTAYGDQTDGRDVASYGALYAASAAPSNKGGSLTGTTPVTGSVMCVDGGTWGATQSGTTVSFTINDYQINTNYFPNSDYGGTKSASVYFNPANGVENASIGCFSAGELFVIVPFGGNGDIADPDYLANKYGAGTVQLTVKDVNLRATSVSGQTLPIVEDNSNQTNPGIGVTGKAADDQVVSTVYLAKEGDFGNHIRYTQTGNYLLDTSGTGNSLLNGADIAGVGQTLEIFWRAVMVPNGDKMQSLYGVNSLAKFDDSRLEVIGKAIKYTNVENADYTFLYAAKPDGTGWRGARAADGSYALTEAEGDNAMDKAVETDLVYYSSLEELEAAGKVCVGVLLEARTDDPLTTKTQIGARLPLQVKNDYDLAGSVAQTCISTTYWTGAAYKAAGGVIPSRLDVQNGTANMPKATNTNLRLDYDKAVYDEDGNYLGGHRGTDNIGDSVYIVPYTPTIDKFVLQENLDGTTKNSFNLDDNQTVVDFKLDMKLKQFVETPTTINTTTVTIVDTLPDGTNYNGDAVLGGTFTLDNANGVGYKGTVTDGTAVGDTDANGITFLSATQGVDADGHNTVTFIFENVPIGATNLPSIYYSITIDKASAKNADGYTNKVTIDTPEDNRPYDPGNGNVSTAGFSVVKNSSLSISKKADHMFVDNGSQISFTLTWQNTGKNDEVDSIMVDTMPYNGDTNGSSFDGSYTLDGVTIFNNNDSATDFTGLSFYYTTDVSARDKTSRDWNVAQITGGASGWTEATINEDGTVDGIPTTGVASWCIIGTLKSSKMIQAHCFMTPVNAKPSDSYLNSISMQDGKGTGSAYIVSRRISGVTWLDVNQDGKRQSNEEKLSGITVRLVSKADFEANGTAAVAVTNLSDTVCEMETGANGAYQFIDLPAGDFVVLFLDGTTLLKDYVMSPTAVTGVSEQVNSDATPVEADDVLESGHIADIEMPAVEDITSSPYVIRYQDAGFYFRAMDWSFTKVAGNDATKPLAGAEFSLYRCTSDEAGHTHGVPGETGSCWELVTDYTTAEDGKVSFTGLISGVYALVETQAPDGYALPSGYWVVTLNAAQKTETIAASGNPTAFFTDDDGNYFMPNYEKAVLPIFGGKGTVALIFGGTLLIGTALVLAFIPRKRQYQPQHKKA